MARTVKIQVEGLKELGERLQKLDKDMAGRVVRAATAAAANVVKKAAIQNAPISSEPHQLGRRKDQIAQPGNLRKNIIIRRLPPAQRTSTEEYIVTIRAGSGKVPKDAFYGKFVEFGTVKMAPRPFLRPAIDNNVQAAIDAMKERIVKRLEKAGV